MVNEPTQWEQEREFFDAKAERAGPFELGLVAARYEAAMSAPLYPLEVAYSLIGNVRGKRILDIGCGFGENSLLFAHWGADVLGVDISQGSINLARKRADDLGVADRVRFEALPFEALADSGEQFDVVWSAAFLHHVLDRLPEVLDKVHALVAPGGTAVFLEPVRLSQGFKKLLQLARKVLPLATDGTPDERPLEPADLRVIRDRFTLANVRHFGLLGDVTSRALFRGGYEKASPVRRLVADSAWKADRLLFDATPARAYSTSMFARMEPKR